MQINEDFEIKKYPNEIRLEKDEKTIIGSNIFPASYYHQNLIELEKCICRLAIDKKRFGTGFLLKLKKGKNNNFYCLITCEHIITMDLIRNKKYIEINYNYIDPKIKSKKKNIKLDENKRFIRSYTYLDIDATVVEIFPGKKEIEKEYFYEINNINSLNKYDIFKKNNIHILQFPLGQNILSYSQGKFLDTFNINEFYHSASTESGSSGSPIFIFYYNSIIIFGIHRGGIDDENKNMGDFIFPILDSIRRDSIFEKSRVFEGEIFENYAEIKYDTTKGGNYINEKTVTECLQKGRLILDKDRIYIGELYHYKPEGRGTLYKYKIAKNKKIIIYSGVFVDGKYEGNGLLYYDFKKKSYYEGEFQNGKRHGKGKYYYNNKLVYEGEFKEDKYHGKGKIYYEDGRTYEGEFTNGVRNGEGVEYASNKKIIDEGEFENGIAPIHTIINRIPSDCNINNMNDTLNELFSCGRGILRIFGMDTNFQCGNCGCPTDFHFLIGNSIWECHKCNSKCKNNCFISLFGLMKNAQK